MVKPEFSFHCLLACAVLVTVTRDQIFVGCLVGLVMLQSRVKGLGFATPTLQDCILRSSSLKLQNHCSPHNTCLSGRNIVLHPQRSGHLVILQ